MHSNKIIYFLLFSISLLFVSSCGDDEIPEIPNDEEVITTVNVNLTPDNGGDTVVFSFQDLDGDGGNAPTITGDTLLQTTTYTANLELLNESVIPADNINSEILTEGDEHQFFFSSTLPGVVINYADMDGNGNPIGLAFTITTGNTGTGNITITLRHQPDKNAANVKDGDITNAGGETDIEVAFDVTVE